MRGTTRDQRRHYRNGGEAMHIRFALVIITSLVTSASALGDQRCPKITRAATGAGGG